eukprot:g5558.t1
MRSSVASSISVESRPPGISPPPGIDFPQHKDDVEDDSSTDNEEMGEDETLNASLDRKMEGLPFDPKAPPECSELVKEFLKETVRKEIERSANDARETERALHTEELKRVKEENERKLKDQIEFSRIKLNTTTRRIEKEHNMRLAILKEDHETTLKNTIEEMEEVFQAEKIALEKRLKEEYEEKTKAFEARIICQRDKAIRRMAAECDLQVKGLRDFYGRDREDALKALDERWSDFVRAQRSHFLLDHEAHETVEMKKCRDEVNASKARTRLLEKQLRRSVGVISETASSRKMGHLKPSPLMRRFLRDATTLDNRTRGTVTKSNAAPAALLFTPPRESAESKLSSPLRTPLLQELGYANPDNLIDTAISETLPLSPTSSRNLTSGGGVRRSGKKEEEEEGRFGTPRLKYVDLDL